MDLNPILNSLFLIHYSLTSGKRQKRHKSGPFDRPGKAALMLGASAGKFRVNNFRLPGHKSPQ